MKWPDTSFVLLPGIGIIWLERQWSCTFGLKVEIL